MGNNICLYARGEILGKEIAGNLSKPRSLEDFLEEFRGESKLYLSFEFSAGKKEALVKIYSSGFWEVVDKTTLKKIKAQACSSERSFFEAALKLFFPEARVEKLRCRAEGAQSCELRVRV